eukprot:285589_1
MADQVLETIPTDVDNKSIKNRCFSGLALVAVSTLVVCIFIYCADIINGSSTHNRDLLSNDDHSTFMLIYDKKDPTQLTKDDMSNFESKKGRQCSLWRSHV